ncbi:hypothetical protein PFISCL1PPCAC_8459, partial [Pristionchus fissidentatus]
IMPEVYEAKEVVMCKNNHEDKFGYPAKIQAVEQDEKGRNRYHIHYQGWNTRYDKWIEHDKVDQMIFKHTPDIEADHKRMLNESQGKSAAKKKTTEATPSSVRKRKAERDGSEESSQSGLQAKMPAKDQELEVQIPDKLRAVLVDDNDLVNRQFKLSKLPARVTVDEIMRMYGETIAAGHGSDEVMVQYNEDGPTGQKEMVANKADMVETSLGITDYFNIIIGSQLLYKMERNQYTQACVNPAGNNAPGKKVNKSETPELEDLKIVPSSIYGLPHLVRLFIRIGPLLAQGKYSEKSISTINKHISDLLIFLSKNVSKFYNLKEDYELMDKHTRDAINDKE